MPTDQTKRCYVCSKVFCCSDCCTEHVKKKHPSRKSVCPLCYSDSLIVKNFDNEEFFCHVVFHHLPLYCRLCGVIYKDSKDLQSFGACNRAGTICRLEKTVESIFSPNTPPSLTKTPSSSCQTRNQSSGTEGDYNANFIDLISPPEFKRNTSTPMHVSGHGSNTNFVFKTPKSPNISLKTPKLSVQVLKNQKRNESTIEKENSSKETSFKNCQSHSSSNESNYQSFSLRSTSLADRTPLRSILSNRSIAMSESSSYSSRSANSGRKMLDAMHELDENARIEDSVTDTVAPDEFPSKTASDNRENQKQDSLKKVRFSDQFQIKNEVESTTDKEDFDATENEIFYEARQSLSELSMPLVDKLSASTVRIIDENERNFEKERKNEESDEPGSANTESKCESLGNKLKSPQMVKPTSEASSSSSRVIMMVVVEKNGNLDTTELVPLLDSSLKKLVSGTSEQIASSLEAPKPKNDSPKSVSSILSVDSYMSFSAIERYKSPNSTINVREPDAGPSSGIFASMAHAVKVAFRTFSGSRSLRNISREPVEQSQHLSLLSAAPESNAASSKVLTNLASALVPRNAKRSRDSDEVVPLRSPDTGNSLNDARSPIPKRPRGWYKIRAREPIARMRNNSLIPSQSISAEMQQRLQQRSLSMDDSMLVLPSRVDQSTQTD